MISVYSALESRAPEVARLTDQIRALQYLLRNFGLTTAKWAKKTGNDVTRAQIDVVSKADYLAIRMTAVGGSPIIVSSSIIKTDYANAAEFFRSNPHAVDAASSLIRWAMPHIDRGAHHFETRWQPSTDGYLAFRAVYPKPKVA